MIYPGMRGDYYSKMWNATEYEAQLDILLDQQSYIAVHEEGFARLTLIEKIGQVVKGLFGGTDLTEEHRVQGAWLKFLYYGEVQGFLKEQQLERLRSRIRFSSQRLHPAIENTFKKIEAYHSQRNIAWVAESDHFRQLREIVTDYHQRHTSFLRPGLWFSLRNPPFLGLEKLPHFGDTPLQLSLKALEQKDPNPHLAFSHLQQAFAIKNDDPAFQLKLAQQLQHLAEAHQAALKDQQKNIQQLWIGLAQTAFKNLAPAQAWQYLDKALQADPSNTDGRLQVGRLYLFNQNYQQAMSFLTELQQAFPHDLALHAEIGHAYWSDAKLDKAMATYETVITSYQKLSRSAYISDSQIASLSARVGMAYFDNLISNDANNLAKSIPYLVYAVRLNPTNLFYQSKLCQAYIQQWEASAGNFVATYGQDWLQFLSISELSAIHAAADKIKKMLLSCSDQFFQVHQNQKAHTCLRKLFELFPNHADMKIAALDLAIRHRDWAPLEPLFDQWKKENYANPYLKKKMGDAYWDKNKPLALKLYQEALDLFATHLTRCQEEEKKTCQNQIAEIHARIGIDHLSTQPGFWKGVPYDEAIQRLEKAASLNPTLHASALFDAYLRAAQAEKERTSLLQDTKKIIAYYQKAFQTLLQKGEYLIELLQLCLSNKPDDAVSLYYEIQKQPWAKELILPAKAWNELAQKLSERKDHETALACHKQAYVCAKQAYKNENKKEFEKEYTKYKQEYFQFSLKLASDNYEKVKTDGLTDVKAIKELLKIAFILQDCESEEILNVEKLKQSFTETWVKIHGSLAKCYLERCWLPLPASEYDSKSTFDQETIKQHKQTHAGDIEKALKHYTKALTYQPENAALHFDKGLLLEWSGEAEMALEEFELAIKHQPRNPFYHKMYGMIRYAVRGSSAGHMETADECAPPHFAEDYPVWKDEYMCSQKTKVINPHDYTTKGSWIPFLS